MRVSADDPIHRVDMIWLGPKGFTLPFEARYLSWAVGGLLVLAGWLLLWILPVVPFSAPTAWWSTLISVALTVWLMSKVTHEVTFRSTISGLIHDATGATRPDAARTLVLRADHVRIHTPRSDR